MKYITITICSLLLVSGVFAQEQILAGGSLSGEVFWRGTVIIQGDITIPKDSRLIIEPGTRILFSAGSDKMRGGSDKTRTELIIRGAMIAQGSSGKKITFSSNSETPRMGDWFGIEFLHTRIKSTVEYCVVEYAYNGITCKNNSTTIGNSEIRYNFNSGIRTEVKARPAITQNIISENGYAGIVCELGAAPVLSDNLITQNPIGMVVMSLSQPNLGWLAEDQNYNPGRNRFANNEKFDVYNHSSKQVYAQNNTWSNESRTGLAQKLYDNADNNKYGSITYAPLLNQRNSQINRLLLLAQNTVDTATEQPASQSSSGPANNTVNTVVNQPESANNSLAEDTTSIPALALGNIQEQMSPLPVTPTAQSNIEKTKLEPKEIIPQIDYNQIFLEPFLDSRRKIIVKKEKFLLTESLRQLLEPGEVRVKVIIDRRGNVESASVLRGINEYLDEAVVETVKKYKYKPGLVNGEQVRFTTSEVFRFQ